MNLHPQFEHAAPLELPYRRTVGIMLINELGLVWTGRRRHKWSADRRAYVWQMPQGGILRGEEPRIAALRELYEETGIRNVSVLAEHPAWLTYDLPAELIGKALKGKYRGQRQKWFAMKFLGDDSEIDIGTRNGVKAEFEKWSWRRPEDLPCLAVPFKRHVYETVTRDFARFSDR